MVLSFEVELSCEVFLKEVMSEGEGRYHTTTGTQDTGYDPGGKGAFYLMCKNQIMSPLRNLKI